MEDNDRASTSQIYLHSSHLVPHLVRSLSKAQPTTQQTTVADGLNKPTSSPTHWISKQKTAAVGHFARLKHSAKGQSLPSPTEKGDSGTEATEPTSGSSPAIPPGLVPSTSLADCRDGDVRENDCMATPESPESPTPHTLAKRLQDMLYNIPVFSSPFSSSASLPSAAPPLPLETEVQTTPTVARDSNLFGFLPSPSLSSSPLEHSWESVRSALDHMRSPFSKASEVRSNPEPCQDVVLDCIDDNNSIMMYGPLEPDESSEVEIAHSEIVSINGDGEEIRTPQPSYTPLPSENFDENAWAGYSSPRGLFTPRLGNIPLPQTSIDQVLMGDNGWGGLGTRSSFSPVGSPVHSPVGSPVHSPAAWSSPGLPPPGLPSPGLRSSTPGSPEFPSADKPPVQEYRVWLPSLTKISVQTMWWGFRIYLPPPVLDILNNKQLEAAKRAALITTALQWLMDHLPVSLLPPQVRPGVIILRHLVPYVGYMGGFVAWSWSAIRSFDKGYGVVLTATWLLPIALIPGTWEADEFPTLHTDPQPLSSTMPTL